MAQRISSHVLSRIRRMKIKKATNRPKGFPRIITSFIAFTRVFIYGTSGDRESFPWYIYPPIKLYHEFLMFSKGNVKIHRMLREKLLEISMELRCHNRIEKHLEHQLSLNYLQFHKMFVIVSSWVWARNFFQWKTCEIVSVSVLLGGEYTINCLQIECV